MYEIPLSLGLIPEIGADLAALERLIALVGTAWLGVAALVFLVIIPLATRRHDSDVREPRRAARPSLTATTLTLTEGAIR